MITVLVVLREHLSSLLYKSSSRSPRGRPSPLHAALTLALGLFQDLLALVVALAVAAPDRLSGRLSRREPHSLAVLVVAQLDSKLHVPPARGPPEINLKCRVFNRNTMVMISLQIEHDYGNTIAIF